MWRTKGEYGTLTGRGVPEVHGQLYWPVRSLLEPATSHLLTLQQILRS
jgi:hypothetical protein